MPEWAELQRKTGQRGFLITSYKRIEKDSARIITHGEEAVRVPAHLVLPGSPQAKQLRHLHAQLLLGQSCHRQKKVLRLCTQVHFGCVQLFATLLTVAYQASLSAEFSRQEYWNVLASTREGNGTPLQYSCLENPMDGVA